MGWKRGGADDQKQKTAYLFTASEAMQMFVTGMRGEFPLTWTADRQRSVSTGCI